jgi:hypothetical protein
MDLTIKFEKKFDLKGTEDLSPKLDVKATFTVPLETEDKSTAKNFEKAFRKEFEKRLTTQMGHFQTWLNDKQSNITEVKRLANELKTMPLPKTEAECRKYADKLDKLARMKFSADALEKDFNKIASDWQKNAVDQQGQIAAEEALKAAAKKMISNKKLRIGVSKTVKGILLVSAIATGAAALILSAGTLGPAVLAIGAATAALSGGAGIAAFAKNVAKDADLEKKALTNVANELKTIQQAMAPVADHKIGHHVAELEAHVKLRKSELTKMNMELKKIVALFNSQLAAVNQMKGQRGANEVLNLKQFDKGCQNLLALEREAHAIAAKIDNCQSFLSEATKLLNELKGFGVKLDDFAKFFKSNSMGSNVKRYLTSFDGIVDLAKSAGSFRPGGGLAG